MTMPNLSNATPSAPPPTRLAAEDPGYPTEEPVEEQPPPEDQDTDFPTEEPVEEQPPPEDQDTDFPPPGDGP